MKVNTRNPLTRSHLAANLLGLAIITFGGGRAGAVVWGVNNSGNWSTTSNWTGSVVPDGAGATASLTYNITSASTVTIDVTSRTVGTLTMGDSDYTYAGGWNSYTLAANAGLSLILDNGASSATIQRPVEYSNSGNNYVNSTIAAPILLNSSLNIANDSRLMLAGS